MSDPLHSTYEELSNESRAALLRDCERLRLLAEDRKDAMTALLRALAALEQQMRDADKPNLAVAIADQQWADQLHALRTAHGGTA